MIVMSETWEDLGYMPKSKVPEEKAEIYKSFKGPPKFDRESESLVEERKNKLTQEIFRVFEKTSVGEFGEVEAAIQDKWFTFWPASDCYLSHSKNKFGHGISKLLELIEKKLK